MGPRTSDTAEAGARERWRETSTLGLVGGLARDVGALVHQEADLLRCELSGKLDQLRNSVVSLVAGAVTCMAGTIFLLLSAVLGLDTWLRRPWLSSLIVGGLVTGIGLLLLLAARHRLRPRSLVPERSARSLHKYAELAKEETRRSA